jgi:low affinity Fe/Cu permease
MSDTREMPGTEPVNTVKKSRGVLLFFISLLFAVVIPAAALLSVLSYTLLQADFYADLLRDGRLITALVEYQYRSMDKRINEEIEEKVGLESYTLVHDRISSEYEAAKAKHGELNSTSEFNTLEAKRSELKKLTWKQSRDLFKTKKDYEEYRERELDKIDRELNEINSWRRGNKKEI